jgi:hypothetical protein
MNANAYRLRKFSGPVSTPGSAGNDFDLALHKEKKSGGIASFDIEKDSTTSSSQGADKTVR